MPASNGKSARDPLCRARAMENDPPDASHIVRCWFEWQIDGLARKVILVVETDLPMQPDENGYEVIALDHLRAAAIARSRASPGAIDGIRIVPVRY